MTVDFPSHGHAPLPHLGVIRVQGADALSFLQGQLTQDFQLLKPDAARLAGWCTPQGRMLVSFIGWRESTESDPSVLLVLWRDRIEAVLKRLRMFVLRAKVQLTDVSDAFSIHGLLSPKPVNGGLLTRTQHGAADIIELWPAPGVSRALWVAPVEDEPAEERFGPLLSAKQWLVSEALSGVAPVMTATAEAFVPQMLNYESVGGVNFKKGCYPGQEVVARSQFRGTLKQRAQVGLVAGPVRHGATVWRLDDGEPGEVGTVALAAEQDNGTSVVIASIKLSALEGRLVVGGQDGPALELQGLPYELAQDI